MTAFQPFEHMDKTTWKKLLIAKGLKQPIIIVTDLLGHFTTLVYFRRVLTIVDSIRNNYARHETVLTVASILEKV